MVYYYTEIVRDNLDITNVIPGQFIFCTDTFDVFYDKDMETRIQVEQGDIFFLNTNDDKESILSPLKNKIYYVKETNTPYRYNDAWFKINDNDMILQVLFDKDEYVPINFATGNRQVAVNTIASQVYTTPNFTAQDEVSQLTLLKVVNRYSYASRQNQMEFEIPFPIKPYNFYRDKMNVVLRNQVISENKYTIQDNMLVFNDNYYSIVPGESILFTFYYNVFIDINEDVQINDKNLMPSAVTNDKIAQGAVTPDKLSDDLRTKIGAITSEDGSITAISAERIIGKTKYNSKYFVGDDQESPDGLVIKTLPNSSILDTPILIKQMKYEDSNLVKRQLNLLDSSGNTFFPGNVKTNGRIYTMNQEVYSPFNVPSACMTGGSEILGVTDNILKDSRILNVKTHINRNGIIKNNGSYIKFNPPTDGLYMISLIIPSIFITALQRATCTLKIYSEDRLINMYDILDKATSGSSSDIFQYNIGGMYSKVLPLAAEYEVQLTSDVNFKNDSPCTFILSKLSD